MTFSFVMAFMIGKVIDLTIGFRATEEAEITGIDLTIHAESAYELGSVTGGGYRGTPSSTSIDTTSREKVQA